MNTVNRVTPDTPLSEVARLMERDGYVLMENALSPDYLAQVNRAYDRQLEAAPRKPGAPRVEIKRILEREPVFADLMDNAPSFRVARALIGADIELASGGELDHKFARTPAYIGWHGDFQWMTGVPLPRQNFWIRCTFFLGDVTSDRGPFTLIPGTHRSLTPCPPWRDANGQPIRQPEQIGMTGPAGSCLINNTEIWHTNWPNTSDHDRRLIMLLYKHAWMKPWQDDYQVSPDFAAAQTDPLRRQLTGNCVWHNGADHFPAHDYPLPGLTTETVTPRLRGSDANL